MICAVNKKTTKASGLLLRVISSLELTGYLYRRG